MTADSTLFARSRAAFQQRQPALWTLLDRLEAPQSTLVADDAGAAVNIDLGKVRLYPEPAPGWSRAQVERYFDEPDHIGFSDPGHCNLSKISRRLLDEVRGYFAERPDIATADMPVVDVGYAFVFGIGLGYHVAELVRRRACRYLILVEPVPEFLLHAMAAQDWQAIFADAEDAGIALHFVVGEQPDGSFALMHYYSWELREAREILNRKIKIYFLSRGFFEDELLMTGNTYGSLRAGDYSIIGHKPYVEQTAPVFIVGSGPSLDDALPHIAKWSDRAVIISCGSSLGILLKNGIRPHLHIENENTEPLVQNLRDFHATHGGFAGITLVASSTVRPEAGALFDTRWYYFRTHLSSTAIFNGGLRPLPGAAPLVANAAFAVATATGFKDIYLFGVDCGRRADAGHHADDAVYYQDDYDNYIEGEGLELLETEFTRTVPGNFGGEIETSAYKDLSRRTFTELIRRQGGTWINCGDGARIDGARPKAAAALDLPVPPMPRADVLGALRRRLRAHAAGSYVDREALRRHVDACDTFATEHRDLVAEAIANGDGAWEFEDRLRRFRNARPDAFDGVNRIAGGSLDSLFRIAVHRAGRIVDTADRKAFFAAFLTRISHEG